MSSYAIVLVILSSWCLEILNAQQPSLEPAWTWLGGNNVKFDPPIYGEKGIPNSENVPGVRYGATGWYDSDNQQFWLFGGYGFSGGDVYKLGMLNDLWRYRVNDSTWTWMSGSNIANQPSVYGVKNTPSTENTPSARYGAVGWYDSLRQELWLFGGFGYGEDSEASGYLNDLWRYRVDDSTWTWMAGSTALDQRGVYGEMGNASITNAPGGRESAVGWHDSSTQELWLFGGLGYDINELGYLNDLWRYRMNDSTWTWISGSDTNGQPPVYGERGVPNTNNRPGPRYQAIGCFDSIAQEFWLFGGYGKIYDDFPQLDYMNDLWRYRVNDSTWTWISGSNTTENMTGIYGEKGVPDIANVPGARRHAIGWCDGNTKELWIFGGLTTKSNTIEAYNDLWRFNISDLTWTWMHGSSKSNHQGTFDQKGVPSIDFMPSARYGAVGWYDNNTKEIWIFSGNASYRQDSMNDLWRYGIDDSTWTWMSGSVANNNFGVYGEKGHPNTSYIPGGRRAATGWFDCTSQELWVFGGRGFEPLRGKDSAEMEGELNDLWRYRVNDSTWTWISGNNTLNQPSEYGEKGIPNSANLPGARSRAFGWYDSSKQEFWLFGGYGKINTNIGYMNDLWRYSVNNETWTWVSGRKDAAHRGVYGEIGDPSTAYVPSARGSTVGWFDSSTQELWLFGGYGYGSVSGIGWLNDLWRYQVNDSTWTWVSGNDTVDSPGVYGDKGIPSPSNYPGARFGAVGWYDNLRQEFWLFGGIGVSNRSASKGLLNDLWKYEVKNNTWTWISGSFLVGQEGVYGTQGIASPENVPGARQYAVGWFDSSTQELWLFGGYGCANTNDTGSLNDLWRYRVNDSTWTWIAGSDSNNQAGMYGDKGIPSTDNYPGAREEALAFYDHCTRSLMLFGGYGYDEVYYGFLNDIWRLSWLEKCPPFHQFINQTCIPLLTCSTSNNDTCLLECNSFSTNNTSDEEHTCTIDGDLILNDSIVETNTVTIIGIVNVSGNVVVAEKITVKLAVGAALHVGKCLLFEEGSEIIVEVDGSVTTGDGDRSVLLATYDSSCSSELTKRMRIELTSSFDECRDGQPRVQQTNDETGRTRLELVFVPMSECVDGSSDIDIMVIAIVVPVATLVLIFIVVVMTVPKLRAKVFPFGKRRALSK